MNFIKLLNNLKEPQEKVRVQMNPFYTFQTQKSQQIHLTKAFLVIEQHNSNNQICQLRLIRLQNLQETLLEVNYPVRHLRLEGDSLEVLFTNDRLLTYALDTFKVSQEQNYLWNNIFPQESLQQLQTVDIGTRTVDRLSDYEYICSSDKSGLSFLDTRVGEESLVNSLGEGH